MEFNITFIIIVLITTLGMVWRERIIEKGKVDRIEKLRQLEDSKIESIGKYEKASSFWNKFRRENRFLPSKE
ncbi:MAG: hypothetical protein AAF039_03205 [Bacteroidota bacterium]